MPPIFPRITAPQGQGHGHHHPTSATAAPLVAFLVLVAALFAVCLFSAAARRFFSLILASSAPSNTTLAPPRRGGGGMDPAEVGSLPVHAYDYGDYGGGGAADVCAVCLGELQAKESVKAIPACGHVFHPPCIDRWLLAGRASCPLCRCSAAATLKPTQHEAAASAA